MITKWRMFYASLASAATFVIVFVVGSYIEIQTPYQRPDGSPDNAPMRALAILILISPILFAIFAASTFAVAVVLQSLRQLKPLVVVAAVAIASIGLSLLMVHDRPFGWHDTLYYFVGFIGMNLITLGVSTFVWWKVATRQSSSGGIA